MKWFWPGRLPSLKRLWSYDAPGAIWRIVPLAEGRIVGEVRRREDRRASFFCLDETTGEPAWEGREFEEPWWIGIEAAAHGVLILHTYEKPDLPQHRDMIAIDAGSGRELWRAPAVAFWFLAEGHVYATQERFESRIVQEIELATGRPMRTFDPASADLARRREKAEESIQTGPIALPIPWAAGEDEELDRLLVRWAGTPEGLMGVESLRLDDYLLVSFFVPRDHGRGGKAEFDNHFRVVDLDTGTLIHQEVLAHSVPAAVPDTFYVRGRAVVSITDLRSLRAQALP